MSHIKQEDLDLAGSFPAPGVEEEPAALLRVLNEVIDRWAEIKRACLPGVPVGRLADDEGELLALKRLIAERTHVRLVLSDDAPDVPRIYLPGASLPFTPVESPVNPLRRLLEAADSARPRDPDLREAPAAGNAQVDPFGKMHLLHGDSSLSDADRPAQCRCRLPENCCFRMLPVMTTALALQREAQRKLDDILERLRDRGIVRDPVDGA